MTRSAVGLYASEGSRLWHYDLNVDSGALVKHSQVDCPCSVQYVWPHANRKALYVVSSNGGPAVSGGTGGTDHHLCAFAIDPASGALRPHGAPVRLRARPIHMSTDIPSQFVLVAYSDPSGLSVHAIEPDGRVGAEIAQPGVLDAGIYAHQIRVDAANRMLTLVTRGHHATAARGELPGALKMFRYAHGLLADEVSVAPNGGFGFGPRHIDFHPTRPWLYASLERQNQLCMFALVDGMPGGAPLYAVDTLSERSRIHPRQMTGTLHVHPNGRFVSVAERGEDSIKADVHHRAGGENTIVTFAIDQSTGAPTLIDRVETRGIHPRTFAIDPSGQWLVAGNKADQTIAEPNGARRVPASLDVFRIGADGKLRFLHKVDADTTHGPMFWMGMIDR